MPASGPTVSSRIRNWHWSSFSCHTSCHCPDLHQQPVPRELCLVLSTTLELGWICSMKICSKRPTTNRAALGILPSGSSGQSSQNTTSAKKKKKKNQIGTYSRSVKGVLSAAVTWVQTHFPVQRTHTELSEPTHWWSPRNERPGFTVIPGNSPTVCPRPEQFCWNKCSS